MIYINNVVIGSDTFQLTDEGWKELGDEFLIDFLVTDKQLIEKLNIVKQREHFNCISFHPSPEGGTIRITLEAHVGYEDDDDMTLGLMVMSCEDILGYFMIQTEEEEPGFSFTVKKFYEFTEVCFRLSKDFLDKVCNVLDKNKDRYKLEKDTNRVMRDRQALKIAKEIHNIYEEGIKDTVPYNLEQVAACVDMWWEYRSS